MKEIETLLQKYSDGTLSSEELENLNRLTHRDAVVGHATQRANAARRRRTAILSTTASLLLIAATGLALYLRPASNTGNAPLLAQQTTVIRPAVQEIAANAPDTPAATTTPSPERKALQQAKIGQKTNTSVTPTAAPSNHTVVEEMATPVTETADPVVACNTQCSPDSVINDIWRFLQA